MTWQSIFIHPERRILRSGWRVTVFFIILIPVAGILESVAVLMLGGYTSQAQGGNRDPFAECLTTFVLIIAALVASAICLRVFDHQPLRSIGYQLHPGWWRDYLVGAVIAALMMTMIVAVGWVTKTLSLDWSNVPARTLLYGFLVSLIFFNIAGAFEEIVFRGYPLQTMLRDLHPAWGVVITSVLFGWAHAGNPNVSTLGLFNTFLAGVWLAVAYLKTRRLWLCASLHWSWNWTMSAVYGLSVSGLEGIVKGSFFAVKQAGPDWFLGGNYGPEGGIVGTLVIILGTVFLWRIPWLTPAPVKMNG